MDYKYIEQLLERYWECQTTIEEEDILRSFFAQEDIPARLLCYRDMFVAEEQMQKEQLSEDFDQRILALIEKKETAKGTQGTSENIKPLTFAQRLRPLYQAAACVAILLCIGMAAQQGFQRHGEDEATLSGAPTMASAEDTIRLFLDMPKESKNTEAVLPVAPDTLGAVQP